MYHRFVRSKKADSHSVPEKEIQDSPSVNLDLHAYTRSRPTIEDIMLYQSHRLTPIPSAVRSNTGPDKSDDIIVDDLAGLDQSSTPDISQYCDIDFDNISPPTNINLDNELDEQFIASLAIPKVLVPPTETGKEHQQAVESPLPQTSNFLPDFPYSPQDLEQRKADCQENITESEPNNTSNQTQKSHKKHKKDKKKEKKDKKKKKEKEEQEAKEMKETEETKATEEKKEAEEAKETKEQKKKKKKKKEGSKKKEYKESTDYTISGDNIKKDIPVYNHSTITVDRTPYPVWSNKYSLYSTNLCGKNAHTDTPPADSAVPSTTADKSRDHTKWQKSVTNKAVISPKLQNTSSSDEFEAIFYQYNDITNVLTPTAKPSPPTQQKRGDLIKEVAQEVQSYFNHPTVASTAGIGTKKSYHQLNHTPSAHHQQEQKRDIQSIINKYCPNNQDSQVYCPKPPETPKESSQDNNTPANNTDTPVRKFGRIIHRNTMVQLTSTLKPTPPDNITNSHPPALSASSLTSTALHPPLERDEHLPVRQPHPPTPTPRPPTARESFPPKPRPPTPYQGTPASRPWPSMASQRPPTSRPRPPTASHGPSISRPMPPTASQRPPISRPRPTTARQGTLNSKPPLPTAHQLLPTSKQRPPSTPQPPSSSSRRPPMAKMVLLQPQDSDYKLIEHESKQLPQLSPSQTEPEAPSPTTSLKPSPPSIPQQLNTAYYRAKIARRLKCVQPGGRVPERRGHRF